jgi:hypothetical protein
MDRCDPKRQKFGSPFYLCEYFLHTIYLPELVYIWTSFINSLLTVEIAKSSSIAEIVVISKKFNVHLTFITFNWLSKVILYTKI